MLVLAKSFPVQRIFPQLKRLLKGTHFQSNKDINKKKTGLLYRMISWDTLRPGRLTWRKV
jgi:hypothetical protein